MSNKNNGKEDPQSAKVLKLGFNISVSGDPGTDFEIVLDDKNRTDSKSPLDEEQLKPLDALEAGGSKTYLPKHETEKFDTKEVQSISAIPKPKKSKENSNSSESLKSSEFEMGDNSASKDTSIINKIKSTMEQFEKFSDHIKEIPRLRNYPVATSTPFSDKYNSRSESSLVYSELKPKRYSSSYDFHSKKEYYKGYGKPSPPDLFLRPLPAEGYYKRGIYTRYFDFEPYRHYGSDSTLNKGSEYKNALVKSGYDFDKYEESYVPSEPLSGILKKSDSESGDKQSTSSADSIKDIKIYQSGGILIMQNFKDNLDALEKKEISEFSAKLIENCNKLKMEVSSFPENKPITGNSSDENKNSGKMVQFDLSSIEGQKSKSGDSSSNALKDESSSKMESSESTSDCMKNKEASPPGTSQSQDFPSLSTQENDSILSNQPGMSPTCTSSKKLEWDSGADIGYLNLDLTKENLSTIEKIVLKGLSNDGLSEKDVVYEKTPEQKQTNRSKFILERKASDLAMEEILGKMAKKSEDVDSSNRGILEQKNGKIEGETEKQANAGGIFKVETRTKLEETKSTRCKNSSKVTPASRGQPETRPSEKLETSDKSVNVNTLFQNASQQTPAIKTLPEEVIKPSEFPVKPKHRKQPKGVLSKSKKPSSQRLRTPKKTSSSTVANQSSGGLNPVEMGVPKKIYKKVEANPTLNDIELSREIDEIIIDQRFKIKTGKESENPVKEQDSKSKEQTGNVKEIKTKNRPISASSSSNNTVLPKPENKEEPEEKGKTSEQRLTDQIIQTSDYDCQSIGIQAFASQVSSDCDMKSFRKTETTKPSNKESANTSSKNIQAFGLNASLPKQLEHPKETEIFDRRHTKSTQFFGGPVNSLPNYHSNLVTKSGESCGRPVSILKTKRTAETEVIRLKEENEKNILANDAQKLAEPKRDARKNDNENKENIMSQKSTNSKRSQSNVSQKNSKGNDSEKKDPTDIMKNSPSAEGSNGPKTSDEVSSVVLTSEALKEHGDSIDRNIIQEKYFQSQLVELEKRKMISRSTSMEIQLQLQDEENVKEYMTTACQYSPQSRGTTSNEHYQEPDDGSLREDPSRRSQLGTSKDTSREQNVGAGDSLPSSTQTAHSWVPGMQNARENTTGVGRARSFEYLPGHIYESSGNLREELPSETEQNLITSCSDSDTAKGSASEGGAKDSEGRNTLILENSTYNSHDSDRLKILDKTLTQLNFTVSKLREKDAQVQNVTKFLLANVCKKMGSGDSLPLGAVDTSKTEPRPNKDSPDHEKEGSNTLSEISTQELKKDTKEYAVSCQTEPKSVSSDSEKFFEQRKVLKKRISEKKRCQIKWIENEIHHLNILREILEKQNSSVQRKKKHSFLTVTSNGDKSEENQPKNALKEIFPRAVTPVYGCTISLSENSKTASEENNPPAGEVECQPQYGMTVSFSGKPNNWQRLITLPVDLQVSLKDVNLLNDSTNDAEKDSSSHRKRSSKSEELSLGRNKHPHSDMCTQYPSPRRVSTQVPLTSQADLSSSKRSSHCNRDNCMCINLSGNSSVTRSSRSKSIDEKSLGKLRFQDGESDQEKRSRLFNPDILEDESFLALESDCKNKRKSTEERLKSLESCKRKSLHNTDCMCQSAPSQQIPKMSSISGSSGCCTKHNSIQSTSCKCQNCSKQLSSSLGKSLITCKGVSQPNIHLEKTSDDYRCSKVQLHKSSNCACHIIKIHGSRCCSSERKPCSARGGSSAKKTENQACQTYCESAQQTEEVKLSKRDCGTSPSEKLTCDTMVGNENSLPRSALNCSCKTKTDEHPRHYFLRIEEKEVDEINNTTKEKKSLEVITVTIPVKKAGKSKIYDTDIQQAREQCNSSPKPQPKGCNCCSMCIGSNQAQPLNYERDLSSGYRRSRAEKPESPTRSSGILKFPENNSYCPEEEPQDFSIPQQFYQGTSNCGFEFEVTGPDSHDSICCGGCSCVNQRAKINQKEYDSHKRRKSIKESYDNGYRYCDDIREYEQPSKMSLNRGRQRENDCSGFKNFRGQSLNGEAGPDNLDYYNYNKREFMTKSEIRKEEEQKRKVHQPSLQEYLCSNRPDFYNSAERRREIINERSKERVRRKNSRMECLLKMLHQCNEKERCSKGEPKRIFTSVEMREQTLKRYKKLPEVTEKMADQKKKEEYRTNRLMADVFAKKLQIEALKGHINLSNNVCILNTI